MKTISINFRHYALMAFLTMLFPPNVYAGTWSVSIVKSGHSESNRMLSDLTSYLYMKSLYKMEYKNGKETVSLTNLSGDIKPPYPPNGFPGVELAYAGTFFFGWDFYHDHIRRGQPTFDSTSTVQFKAVLQWNRRKVVSPDTGLLVPDSSDNPPGFIYLVEQAGIDGLQRIDQRDQNPLPYSIYNFYPGKEFSFQAVSHPFGVELTLAGMDQDGCGATYAANGFKVVPIKVTGDKVEGEYRAFGGNIHLNSTYSNSPYHSLDVMATARLMFNYTATVPTLGYLPDPDNPALYDGSQHSQTYNQYVITDGVVPTAVTVSGGNADFLEWLRQNTTWELNGGPPLLPQAPAILGNGGVAPSQPIPTPTPDPMHEPPYPAPVPIPTTPGLRFDIRTRYSPDPSYVSNDGWNFPSSNSAFGEKTLTHIIDGKRTNSQIALFYPSDGFQHPDGGPPGYIHYSPVDGINYNVGEVVVGGISYYIYHHEVPTPNWFYYYSKSVTPPWGYSINYRPNFNGDSASVYFPGQDHVHIGNNAHGSLSTDLFAVPSGSTFAVAVGVEMSNGIDTFARVVQHECTHKRMYENLQALTPQELKTEDADVDGVPDTWETGVGLDPTRSETITGWKANNDAGSAASSDNEVFCRMTERGMEGDINSDWATNGLNWIGHVRTNGEPYTPNSANRHPQYLDAPYDTQTLSWKNARLMTP